MAVVHTKKSLGQHFLEDRSVLEHIVETAEITSADTVLEIGPGSGNMTTLLAEKAGRLEAVEIDRSLEPILREELKPYPAARVTFGDFMKLTDRQVTALTGGPFKVVANLPYYITTPIMERLLEGSLPIRTVTVLIQKEAAERLISPPGGREYGPLSIRCARWGTGGITLIVPPEAFMPPPKVDSAVVHLTRYDTDPYDGLDEAFFRKVVRTAFTQRRKQLKNTLGAIGFAGALLEAALSEAGLDGSRRPETLTVEEFVRLARALSRPGGKCE